MKHIYILIAFLQNQFHMTNHTIDLLFLAGRLECSTNEFYNLNLKNENLIDSLPLRKMSKLTHNMFEVLTTDM